MEDINKLTPAIRRLGRDLLLWCLLQGQWGKRPPQNRQHKLQLVNASAHMSIYFINRKCTLRTCLS
eukprot:scaffold18066_cov78-Skeletonema_dohrnii-CCMP3373.AAC.2